MSWYGDVVLVLAVPAIVVGIWFAIHWKARRQIAKEGYDTSPPKQVAWHRSFMCWYAGCVWVAHKPFRAPGEIVCGRCKRPHDVHRSAREAP